jgi:MFS family permease
MEIPALVLIPRLRRKFPLAAAIGGAVFIFAIEVFLYTRAKSLAQIARIQIIGGLGSGLWIGAVIRYVYLLAPKGLNSTALTTYSAVSAVSVIIGSPLGGILIGNIGIVSFYRVVCGLLVFSLLFLCGTLRAGVKVLNKPLPFLRDD